MFFKNELIFDNLLRAIQDINRNAVQALILEAQSKKIDLNAYCNKKVTLVHWAVLKCRESTQDDMLQIIQELFKANIDLNKPSNDSKAYYPLHTASRRALPKIVEWLQNNGADPLVADITKKTPLKYVNQAIKTKTTLKGSERGERDDMILNRLYEVRRLLTQAYPCHSENAKLSV